MQKEHSNLDDSQFNKFDELYRYLSFWPYLTVLIGLSILSSFFYIRYTTFTYNVSSVIEIIDKAQDNEMALPTSLTVFNRSMINLENEINRLNSFSLNMITAKELKSNIRYYKQGLIKTTESTKDSWYDDYNLSFKIDTENIDKKYSYTINVDNDELLISTIGSNDILIQEKFNSLTTLNKKHNLPFDLTINSDKNLNDDRKLIFIPIEEQVNIVRNRLRVIPLGQDSDQLSLNLRLPNQEIGSEYLNTLMKVFNNDGIVDKQSEYSRTIEFVDKREKILKSDLEKIELRKQDYKQRNNLSDIKLDANNNINLKNSYDGDIFKYESQKEIASYLLESLESNQYDYLPINVGLDNFDLNNMIIDYNKIVTERNNYLSEAGTNNILVKSLSAQLESLIKNISVSLQNFLNSIELNLASLRKKEFYFDDIYNKVPENEKTLRSIERELSIKEALYLLLLQKREEASINLAVVKPSIKIIDNAIIDKGSKYPNILIIYAFPVLISILIYFSFLYLWFYLDNKIHSRDQLVKLLDPEIPIICEIPFIKDKESLILTSPSYKRSTIAESIRMLTANLQYTLPGFNDPDKCKVILFTSSIKGEGKTLSAVNAAVTLKNDSEKEKKVLLLGTDLRNPQIHKNFNLKKDIVGISEIIYRGDNENYKKYINTIDNLDILLSGAIPPNPTSLLSNINFEKLITKLKKDYDYIIIDSAPCLLVSDTLQIIKHADSVVYLFRSNYSDAKLITHINSLRKEKNLNNINLVLNAVGNSAAYGYKYGYQYGYKYSYNYGYGYGYNSSDR